MEEREICDKHGREKEWADCWNCDTDAGTYGFSSHDCGDDTCCCLFPEPNVRCDICNGEGGYLLCSICAPGSFE